MLFSKSKKVRRVIYNSQGVMTFDGEYCNGKANGQGTAYYSNGKIKYHGEFKDGVPHGEGKLYSLFGDLIYSGHFENGFKKNGTYYYNGTPWYRGKCRDFQAIPVLIV